MKILIDTNVLIAASRYPNGIPFKALLKASNPLNRLYISEQNLEEIRNVYNRKFPRDINILESFLASVMPMLEVIKVPVEKFTDEAKSVI